MKILVMSLDQGTRLNTIAGEVIHAFRPSVVTPTEFLKTLTMSKAIDPAPWELPDSATDELFEKFWKECEGHKGRDEADLAIESFRKAIHDSTNLDDAADAAAAAQAEEDRRAAAAQAEKDAANAAASAAAAQAEKDAAKPATPASPADAAKPAETGSK